MVSQYEAAVFLGQPNFWRRVAAIELEIAHCESVIARAQKHPPTLEKYGKSLKSLKEQLQLPVYQVDFNDGMCTSEPVREEDYPGYYQQEGLLYG